MTETSGLSTFSLLLLQLDRDTSHRAFLNSLQQMNDINGYLNVIFFSGDIGYLLAHTLVGMEAISQACAVFPIMT